MAVTLSGLTAPSTHLSGNDIMVKATTSGFPLNGIAYQLLLKINSPEGELDGAPFVAAITPNAAGEATFNLSGYVDQRFDRKLTWPIKPRYTGKIVGWQEESFPVWLYPGESWIDTVTGDLVERYEEVPLQPIMIVKGRLPEIILSELNEEGVTWFEKYCGGGKFFTYMPLEQQVTPYQPVKLWWIPPMFLTNEAIYLKYYIGGISETITLHHGELYGDILWEIECHPVNAGVPLIDANGNLLEKYEIWIENNDVAVTEKRIFVVNWTPPQKHYYYLFADNRMGGIDVIGLTGRTEYRPTGERIISQRPYAQGAGIQFPTQIPVSSRRTRKWVINSGWKPKEELKALDFLLDAQHAWLAIPPATGSTTIEDYKLCPVIITNSEFILNNDTKDIESVDIELEEAY